MKYIFSILLALVATFVSSQNKLQPGFNANEYAQLLSLAFYGSGVPDSTQRVRGAVDPYRREYRSQEVGLKNRWTLYLRNDSVASIDLRGTVNHVDSWMANFYAAMIPATGYLQINDSTRFDYQLATDAKAAVHVGWTVALAHLAPDIEEKINTIYTNRKIKEFLIFGHSQGGALAFLLRSWLEYERKKGKIPADIVFKTYCSAAPKPGNSFYAYDFDFITRGGWAYTVVNAADWVPEMPFSVQQITDLNATNPLIHAKTILKKQKFLLRFVGDMVYRKMEKKPRKAQKKFERYLGKVLYKRSVSKILPQFKEPDYIPINNYTRAGIPIVLLTDDEYLQKFPDSNERFFVHHLFAAYYFLLKKWYAVGDVK